MANQFIPTHLIEGTTPDVVKERVPRPRVQLQDHAHMTTTIKLKRKFFLLSQQESVKISKPYILNKHREQA